MPVPVKTAPITADWAISAVSYTDDPRRIRGVRVHQVYGGMVMPPDRTPYRRETVIEFIQQQKTVKTIVAQGGAWVEGAPVGIVQTKNEVFLRTDGNAREEDNLGELPELEPGEFPHS